tara:strand:+ start:484 stop:870 length:387 start_codon:yes stop_codon:yes gene_type:complete
MKELRTEVHHMVMKLKLNVPNRKRSFIHKRFYLMSLLRVNGVKLKEIGSIFNQDHSTVVHGLKKYADLRRFKDSLLDEDTRELREQFGEHFDKPVFSIIYDMRNATNPYDFKVIRERLDNQVYIDVKY